MSTIYSKFKISWLLDLKQTLCEICFLSVSLEDFGIEDLTEGTLYPQVRTKS